MFGMVRNTPSGTCLYISKIGLFFTKYYFAENLGNSPIFLFFTSAWKKQNNTISLLAGLFPMVTLFLLQSFRLLVDNSKVSKTHSLPLSGKK